MKQAIRVTVFITALCGIVFPALLTLFGQLLVPDKAEGSLIQENGKFIGSELIAQPFTSKQYFHGRPSAVDQLAGASAGDNLAASNPELGTQMAEFEKRRQVDGASLPDDARVTSGSGFDPHISLDYARAQVKRIATERDLPPDEVRRLIEQEAGNDAYVNVLLLNLALDRSES
ncbi:potassium-transporting ATPase subunit C [Exiguobacterium oxidotolerans]|uniref:Potassium-transporting ATPase KdpC subunit n=1 Tax=Exiguobacterium oxidotolerans TaxID=223958 RepID=A0A653I7U8_9BACL|nr:potassium-transporting ATPase subunit C [Exiguobacterium oxidotolerans]VWX35180.1 Potassium-transporting ATPase KdpC subunit [Exiguobacterium oxidotolerans]